MASPPAVKKLRRRSMAEPTMTLHSRAATDEVLDMFNQTLQNVDSINEESHNPDDSYYEDDDYTSGGESTCTGTGRLSGTTSNCDEETEALDKTTQSLKEEITEPDSASPWSELSTDKHVPGLSEIHTSDSIGLVNEEFKTPNSQENQHKSGAQFMPSPPEGFEPPTHPYRDPEQTNQNRLPFMTPIVEITESSLSMPSSRLPVDYFTHKTPSRRRHDGDPSIPELEDLILDEDTTYYQKLSRVEEEVPEAQLPAFGDSSSTPTQTTRSHIEDLSLIEPIILLESESSERKRHDPEAAAPSSELGQLSLLDLSARLVMDTKSISVIREAIGRPDRDVVIFDDHINPVDDDMRQRIIQSLEPSITTYPGYYNHNPVSSQIKSDLERLTKTGAKKPKNGNEKSNNNGNEVILTTSIDEVFTVKQLLGRGGWATVFLAEKTSNNEEIELQAMKSEFDPSAWEYSLMVLAQARLAYYPQQESRRSIVSVATPLSYHSYSDAGYMFESFHDQGNLLELVNKIKADALPGGLTSGAVTPGVDEQIAMFFAIEILRTVSNMHLIGILHCDIKADNFLVRLDSIDESLDEWSSVYSASGAQGWSFKGIVLIDFGRAIDTLAFKPDTCFYAEWATDKHDCPEQREARPWTYHTDLWGIASIISVLLFGKVLEETVIAEPSSSLSSITSTSNLPLNNGSTTNSKRYKLRDPLKRYWQTELWSDAFDVLMNPAQHASQSERVGRGTGGIKGLPAMKLSSVRERMEAFLEENAEKKGLKQSLKKLEDKLNASSYNATRRR